MNTMMMCVARPSGDHWEGLCLDLDIAVEGRTFEEVRDRLQEAVPSYIEDALAEEEPARSRLLSRRAPLRIRLAWGLRILAMLLLKRRKRENGSVVVPVSCPA